MKRALFALALAAALPMTAQAGEVNYNYVQAGYQSSDIIGVDFGGYELEGSFGFHDNWYGFASTAEGSYTGVDVKESQLGAGFHTSGDGAQWFGELSWVNVDLALADDDGIQLAGGVRGFLGEKFEGQARIGYANLDLFDDRISYGVQGVYHFSETWGAYGSFDKHDYDGFDADTWAVGVRASF